MVPSICYSYKFHITLAIIWLALAIIVLFGIPMGTLISAKEWSLKIRSDKGWFKYWKRSQRSGVLSVYFFNITNPDEVMGKGARANLSQVGPFEYEVIYDKVSIDFKGDEGVSYSNKYKYHFIHPELRKHYHHDHSDRVNLLSEDASIFTFNFPLVIALKEISRIPLRQIKQAYMGKLSKKHDIIKNISIRELLSVGFVEDYDSISDIIASINKSEVTKSRCHGLFSWIFGANNSISDHFFLIDTGYDDFDDVNTLISIDNTKQLPYWKSRLCNSLRGVTVDKMFVPPIDDDIDWIKIYEPLACRVMKWKIINDQAETYAGEWLIDTKKVELDESNFLNSDVEKNNACYETDTKSPDDYHPNIREVIDAMIKSKDKGKKNNNFKYSKSNSRLPSGVIDTSMCNGGVPIFMSQPYFISGDHDYFCSSYYWIDGPLSDEISDHQKNILNGRGSDDNDSDEEEKDDGRKSSNKTVNQSFMDIEPYTGSVIRSVTRLQVNLAMSEVPKEMLPPGGQEMRRLIYPLFWYEYEWEVTNKQGKKLWLILELSWILAFTFFGILLFFTLISLAFAYWFYVNGRPIGDGSSNSNIWNNPFRGNQTRAPPARAQTFATYESNVGVVTYGQDVSSGETVARLRI